MMGGSIQAVSIGGTDFSVAAGADAKLRLGGVKLTPRRYGNGTTVFTGETDSWSLSDLEIAIDASRGHLQSNTTVMLQAPSAMIYRNTELLVRKCTRKQNKDSKTTELDLVLPEAFGAAAIPVALPWDEAPQ